MEKIKQSIKDNLFYIIAFCSMSLLAFLFVPSAQEWKWGSVFGPDLMRTAFDGYNGRYFGNICAIAFMRLPILIPFIKAMVLLIVLLLITKIAESKGRKYGILAFVLLSIPTGLFVRSFALTTGFALYYLSAAIILFCFYLVLTSEKAGITELILILVLSVSGQLFSEIYTFFSLFFSLALLVYNIVKKKPLFANISHSLGCIIGAVLMFSNSGYKSNSILIKGAFSRLFMQVFYRLFVWCFPLLIVMAVISVIMLLKSEKPDKRVKIIVITSAFALLLIFLLLSLINKRYSRAWLGLSALDMLAFYLISCILCLEKKQTLKVAICYVCAAFIVLSCCLIKAEYGCLTMAYILGIIALESGFEKSEDEKYEKAGFYALSSAALIILAVDIFIYSLLTVSTNNKIRAIREEAQSKNYSVEYNKSSLDYFARSDEEMTDEEKSKYFCNYYDLPDNMKITFPEN